MSKIQLCLEHLFLVFDLIHLTLELWRLRVSEDNHNHQNDCGLNDYVEYVLWLTYFLLIYLIEFLYNELRFLIQCGTYIGSGQE